MDKYKVDIDNLDKVINAPKKIKLADVQDKIEKIGFGVVRFLDNSHSPKLWQVDGDYIVAMYDEEKKVQSDWTLESDKLNKSATIFYKNTPIKSLAFSEFNVKDDEVNTFKQIVVEKLANNKELVKMRF
jgi:hypothetical protein